MKHFIDINNLKKKLEKYKIGKRLDTFSDCISLVKAKKNFYVNYKKNLSMGEKKIYKISEVEFLTKTNSKSSINIVSDFIVNV